MAVIGKDKRCQASVFLLLRVGQLHDAGLFKILRAPLPQLREVQESVEVRREHRQSAFLRRGLKGEKQKSEREDKPLHVVFLPAPRAGCQSFHRREAACMMATFF